MSTRTTGSCGPERAGERAVETLRGSPGRGIAPGGVQVDDVELRPGRCPNSHSSTNPRHLAYGTPAPRASGLVGDS